MDMNERIKDLRKKAKMSQTELGEKTNISIMTISSIENGKTDPSTKQLKALSDFFNVSTDYIIKGIETERTISENEQEILEIVRKDKEVGNALIEMAKIKKKVIRYAKSYRMNQMVMSN